MHEAKWEAEYLSSWPCLTSHSLNLNTLSCLRFVPQILYPVKKGSKSEEGDEITEAEAGATGLKMKERGHEPRNAGSL